MSQDDSPVAGRRGGGFARGGAMLALALLLGTIVYMFFASGADGTSYRLLFATGGQLVPGNEVLIGGQPVGTIKSVELNDDAQAEIDIEVDRKLHQGSTAVVRTTSLSGVANRYISISPGPNSAPELDDDQLIAQDSTTSPVDLDQLFNSFDEPTLQGLRDVIRGSAATYTGAGPEANQAYRFLNPAITSTDRLVSEIDRDEQVLTDFLVSGSRVVGAVAERRDDLAGLVTNGNQALGAIAVQNDAFDRALRALPPALRQADTTFANLRPTLDDLDPLVATSKVATRDLAPFLRHLRQVLARSGPVVSDLAVAINKPGKSNDLINATDDLSILRERASTAIPRAVSAMQNADDFLKFARPYIPDLTGAISGLGQITAYYDADGHYARVTPAGMGIFHHNTTTNDLEPISVADMYNDYGPFGSTNQKIFKRCPGGATQANLPSNPFLDGGNLSSPAPPGDCNVGDVPSGP